MVKLICPICWKSQIQLLSIDNNIKTKKTTSLNVNLAKPLTVFNHNEKRKKKKSKAKIGLGILTGGTSLFLTGIKDNKGNEYHCMSCGHRWKGK